MSRISSETNTNPPVGTCHPTFSVCFRCAETVVHGGHGYSVMNRRDLCLWGRISSMFRFSGSRTSTETLNEKL